MFATRKVDLRLVIFFLLCKMEDSRTLPTISRYMMREAMEVLLVILRVYFKDDAVFKSGEMALSEVMNEVILKAESQGVLRVESGGVFSFLPNQHERLRENCQGVSHSDHWALQTCCEVAVAAYKNNVTVENLFPVVK